MNYSSKAAEDCVLVVPEREAVSLLEGVSDPEGVRELEVVPELEKLPLSARFCALTGRTHDNINKAARIIIFDHNPVLQNALMRTRH